MSPADVLWVRRFGHTLPTDARATLQGSARVADPTSSLRADAARNRELILDAARGAFAQHGLDVSLREIARRAGVSEPTLRRRFASKEELVGEAFEDKVEVYAGLALAALEEFAKRASGHGYRAPAIT